MGRGRFTLFIAWACLLVPIYSARLRADTTTNAPKAPSAPVNGPVDVPGQNYVHNYTGFTFPPMVGEFKRMQVTSFNANASDIGVDYADDPLTAHVSVSVYPARNAVRPHYEQCRDQVTQVHPDAKLVEEKPVTLTKTGAGYDGFSALFTYQGQLVGGDPARELFSKLIVFRYGDYFITFRISYAEEDRAATEKRVEDFLQKLDWPPPSPSAPDQATPSPTPASPPAPGPAPTPST